MSLLYIQHLGFINKQGSQAYVKALLKAGLIDQVECEDISRGLTAIKDEWRGDRFNILPSDEDVHSANERRLTVTNRLGFIEWNFNLNPPFCVVR